MRTAFVEDGDIAANIFDVYVAYQEGGPFTKILSDVPSNKERPMTMQQFKVAELARYVQVSTSVLGSGLLDLTEVWPGGECGAMRLAGISGNMRGVECRIFRTAMVSVMLRALVQAVIRWNVVGHVMAACGRGSVLGTPGSLRSKKIAVCGRSSARDTAV